MVLRLWEPPRLVALGNADCIFRDALGFQEHEKFGVFVNPIILFAPARVEGRETSRILMNKETEVLFGAGGGHLQSFETPFIDDAFSIQLHTSQQCRASARTEIEESACCGTELMYNLSHFFNVVLDDTNNLAVVTLELENAFGTCGLCV
jgi:hypothetical protein